MDPSIKNWLSLFIDEFDSHLQNRIDTYSAASFDTDLLMKFAHFYIHKSGLFYGQVNEKYHRDYQDSQSWSIDDNFKISLVEGLFLMFVVSDNLRITKMDSTERRTYLKTCIQKIYEFYFLFSMQGESWQKYHDLYTGKVDELTIVEQVIDLRLSTPSILKRDFWKGSLFNIYSALDVFYFAAWLTSNYSYDYRDKAKLDIIAVMNQACEIKGTFRKNGEAVVSYFIASGDFINAKPDTLYTHKSCDFDECVKAYPVVLRLFLYEYAAFVCFVDTFFNVSAMLFLQDLARKLQLENERTRLSLSSIEDYVMEEGKNIFYLNYGEGVAKIRKTIQNRYQTFINKNKQKILTEVLESKELVELIRKSVSEDLSESEKKKVKEQIMDILKTLPSLAIFMVPGGAILLPMLLKIIPEEILMPSSFLNKKKDDEL